MKLNKKLTVIIAVAVVAAVTISYATGVILTSLLRTTEYPMREGFMAAPAKIVVTKTMMTTLAATKTAPSYEISSELPGRMLVKTANLNLECGDPEEAVNKIIIIVESYGGYIARMSVHSEERSSANLLVKVPENHFFEALEDVKKLGKVLNEEISSKDVTEQHIDLEARLRNLRAEEEWLVKTMEKASDVKELLMVERELWRIRGEIERLEAQMKNLERMVEYSSISISITTPSKPKPPPSPYPKIDLTPILAAAVTAVIYIVYGLVFLIIVGAPLSMIAYAGYLIYRKVAKKS